jgi:uncharacterized membrane protein
MTQWIEQRLDRLEGRMSLIETALEKLGIRPAGAADGAPCEPPAPTADPRRKAFERWRGGVETAPEPSPIPALPGLGSLPDAPPHTAFLDSRAGREEPATEPAAAPIDLHPAATATSLPPDTANPPDAAPPTRPFWPNPRAAREVAALPQSDPQRRHTSEAALASTNAHGVDLEVRIGTRWVAWVGALLVVVAVGFFVKLAYDNGWVRLSAGQKCALAAGFGLLLLGFGEFCLRRFGRMAAVSLFASGLGVLYLTTYASYRYFNLFDEGTAFTLLGLVGLVGVALTLRARMLTIGLISLVGGYAAPVLLNSASTNAMALPSYATVLLTIALGLSWRMSSPFRPLRYWGLALHGILCTLWLLSIKAQAWPIGAGFLALWWAMVTVESLIAARKNESPDGNAAASFLATAWLASAGCWLLAAHASRDWLGSYAFALAGAAAAVAALSGAGLAALRQRPTHALAKLSASLWAQCGVLLATAIALQFNGAGLAGVGRTIGWLTLALACFELSRAIRSRGVQVFGFLVGGLALLQLLAFDLGHAAVSEPRWFLALGVWGGLKISVWSLIALYAVAILAWTAARVRIDGSEQRSALVTVLAFGALIGWLLVSSVSATGNAVTLMWIAPIPALVGLDRMRPQLRLLAIAPLLLAAGAMRWLAIDAIGGAALGGNATAMLPIVNPQMFTAALIVGGLWLVGRAMQARQVQPSTAGVRNAWATAVPVGAWFFGLIALSFELSRALTRIDLSAVPPAAQWPELQWHFLWILALWSAGAFGMLIEGRRAPSPALTTSGWGVLLVASVAWLTVGTALPRVMDGVVACTPLLNAQFAAGFLIALLMLVAARNQSRAVLSPGQPAGTPAPIDMQRSLAATLAAIFALVALIGLWLGTLELDRAVAFAGTAIDRPGVARQTAFSAFWGLYAIVIIAIGFAKSATWMRRGGLALLGLTLVKVVLIDMADAGTVYRVLSFLVLGLVLIVTSIIYARLAQRLVQPNGKSVPAA